MWEASQREFFSDPLAQTKFRLASTLSTPERPATRLQPCFWRLVKSSQRYRRKPVPPIPRALCDRLARGICLERTTWNLNPLILGDTIRSMILHTVTTVKLNREIAVRNPIAQNSATSVAPFIVFTALACFGVSSVLRGQLIGDTYTIGISLLKNERRSCPAFVFGVYPKSPAGLAGIQSGDKLLKVDGIDVSSFGSAEISRLIRDDRASEVSIRVERQGAQTEFTMKLEKFSSILADAGFKIADDAILPIDEPATEQSEKVRNLHFDPDHIDFRVFPMHYPTDLNLYYGGFEVYVFRMPSMVVVGGIESSPASRAGIHWGDTILKVNGVPVVGKSLAELERMFSADHPVLTKLTLYRASSEKTIIYTLAKASDIIAENSKSLYKGGIIPSGVADGDLHCFDR